MVLPGGAQRQFRNELPFLFDCLWMLSMHFMGGYITKKQLQFCNCLIFSGVTGNET